MKSSRTAKDRITVPGYRQEDEGSHSMASLALSSPAGRATSCRSSTGGGYYCCWSKPLPNAYLPTHFLPSWAGQDGWVWPSHFPKDSATLPGWSGSTILSCLWMESAPVSQTSRSGLTYYCTCFSLLLVVSVNIMLSLPLLHHSVNLWTTPNLKVIATNVSSNTTT